jgi:hypothetical protein
VISRKARIRNLAAAPDVRAMQKIVLMRSLHRIGLGIASGTFKGVPGAVRATADFSA